ncbi:MAG: hypothetical protein ABH825_04060 [Candidatus Omnitrophota bacterium]
MKRKKTRPKKTGFMLFEVIVSVLIIGTAIVFVVRSFSTSIKAMNIALGLSKASLLAENKISELEMSGKVPQESEQYGFFEGEDSITWAFSCERQEDNKNLALAKLEVDWKIGSGSRKAFLDTYFKVESE